jgi:hypothetical protein
MSLNMTVDKTIMIEKRSMLNCATTGSIMWVQTIFRISRFTEHKDNLFSVSMYSAKPYLDVPSYIDISKNNDE